MYKLNKNVIYTVFTMIGNVFTKGVNVDLTY